MRIIGDTNIQFLKYRRIALTISLVVILAIYDVSVRRTRPTRFIFGMKPPRS